MKVVQIITRMIVGGSQAIATETAAELRRRGIDCEIWTGPQTGPEGNSAVDASRRGIPVVYFPSLVREVSPVKDVSAIRAITRRLRDERPDIIHTHSSKAGIIGRRAAREAARTGGSGSGTQGPYRPRVLHTIHGWGWSARTPLAARAIFVAAERVAARWTDRLVAVSGAVRSEGLRLGIGRPDQYVVIRPGIDPAPFRDRTALRSRGRAIRAALGIPGDAVVAGTVGRVTRQKNPHAIVEAARRFPRIHWLIVGDGPLRGEVEERIRSAGMSDRVHLAGLRSDVPDCLGAMDIFVLPSLWEGLPITVLEARAAGLPIVASDAGGTAEAVPAPPCGRTFAAGDSAAWIAAIEAQLAEMAAGDRPVPDADVAGLGIGRMLDEILELYGLPLREGSILRPASR